MIGLKDSRHLFIQSEVKPKPIVTRSHAFSRALRQPHVITSSFDWFNVLSVSYVIGQSNYFGFGFTTLKRKPLYTVPDLYILIGSLSNCDDNSGENITQKFNCTVSKFVALIPSNSICQMLPFFLIWILRTVCKFRKIHMYLYDIYIIKGVHASGVIIDLLLWQCCFVWSQIVGPHSSGNFNDWPLKLYIYI